MLPDVAADSLAMLRTSIGQDVLDEVISKLVASNWKDISIGQWEPRERSLTVNQWHARTVRATLADALQIPVQKLGVTNLKTLLNDLGGVLIHAVLGGEAEDVVDGTTAVGGSTMLTDVLDAPVTELAVGDDIDAGKDFIDTRTL